MKYSNHSIWSSGLHDKSDFCKDGHVYDWCNSVEAGHNLESLHLPWQHIVSHKNSVWACPQLTHFGPHGIFFAWVSPKYSTLHAVQEMKPSLIFTWHFWTSSAHFSTQINLIHLFVVIMPNAKSLKLS